MAKSQSDSGPESRDALEVRERILDAAFMAFMEHGFAAASTLDIASRARVSKRELYALVGNKQQMLVACISARSKRLQPSATVPIPDTREGLLKLLTTVGQRLVLEITDPTVISVFRLAIAEAVHAPEVAASLDSIGREATRAYLRQVMGNARTARLIDGRPAELAEQFGGLLWGNLMVSLLLGVAERPNSREIAARARDAAAAFLRLHPSPED